MFLLFFRIPTNLPQIIPDLGYQICVDESEFQRSLAVVQRPKIDVSCQATPGRIVSEKKKKKKTKIEADEFFLGTLVSLLFCVCLLICDSKDTSEKLFTSTLTEYHPIFCSAYTQRDSSSPAVSSQGSQQHVQSQLTKTKILSPLNTTMNLHLQQI